MEEQSNVRCTLKTVQDCGRELAKLIRLSRSGRLDTQDLSRYANALQILTRILEGGELEARIAALEAKQ